MREKNFGLDRVIYPKGVSPVAAWKVNNDINISQQEARIRIDSIHIESDSFQQICNSCGFDERKIRNKILDIIEKRGKLHNPFTKTGGVLTGVVDEIGAEFNSDTDISIGEKVYCITSICGMPIKIESIDSIDYDYGEIKCKGYGIIFESFPIRKGEIPKENSKCILAALDEAGSVYGAYKLARHDDAKNIAVISKSTYTTLLYGVAIDEAASSEARVTAIMDNGIADELSKEEITEILDTNFDYQFFVDMTRPMDAFNSIRFAAHKLNSTLAINDMFVGTMDLVVVAEDVLGAETIAVSLVKPGGTVYFSAVGTHYATATLIAENIGKEINMRVFDQYSNNYPKFTKKLTDKASKQLESLNSIREQKRRSNSRLPWNKVAMKTENRMEYQDFVFRSPVTKTMLDEVLNIARYDCNVILQGETGVGKEKVLSLIHQNSQRRSEPCIKINCATIQENLAESEFFGYESGAFTGAKDVGKKGYFEMANNGILFLDEIGTLSLNMQSKLLRVLQESQFYRVGGTQQVSVNVRVIVANNVNLKDLVREGKFREDLYYRLNICTINVPPLRERRDDITCLAEAFSETWVKKYGVEKELSKDALEILYHYDWPGNVRELENIVHRLIIGSKSIIIEAEDVTELLHEETYVAPNSSVKSGITADGADFHTIMERQEKQIIEYALEKCKTTRKAAEFLSLPQTTFARKKLKHGL